MIDPVFWLGLSILLVAVSLTVVLVVAVPAFQELARAARSAEKLFDTLSRELPPTLEAIRLTGMEITELTDEMSEGVQSAGRVVKQVDQNFSGVRQQAQQAQVATRSMFVGMKAAWQTFRRPSIDRNSHDAALQPSRDLLPSGSSPAVNLDNALEPVEEHRYGDSTSPQSAYADDSIYDDEYSR